MRVTVELLGWVLTLGAEPQEPPAALDRGNFTSYPVAGVDVAGEPCDDRGAFGFSHTGG